MEGQRARPWVLKRLCGREGVPDGHLPLITTGVRRRGRCNRGCIDRRDKVDRERGIVLGALGMALEQAGSVQIDRICNARTAFRAVQRQHEQQPLACKEGTADRIGRKSARLDKYDGTVGGEPSLDGVATHGHRAAFGMQQKPRQNLMLALRHPEGRSQQLGELVRRALGAQHVMLVSGHFRHGGVQLRAARGARDN